MSKKFFALLLPVLVCSVFMTDVYASHRRKKTEKNMKIEGIVTRNGHIAPGKGYESEAALFDAFILAVAKKDVNAFLRMLTYDSRAKMEDFYKKNQEKFRRPNSTKAFHAIVDIMHDFMLKQYKIAKADTIILQKDVRKSIVDKMLNDPSKPSIKVKNKWYIHFKI